MQYLLNRPLRNSKTYSVALLLICVTIYMIHKRITLKKYVIIHWQSITSNVTCHYSNEGDDALPDDISISSEVRSIFFHETSCRGGLNSRQACAVESAARAHPNWQVYVLFSSPVTHHVLNNSCIGKLLQFPNVNAARIHITDYLRDTPLSNHSNYTIENIGDVLKFVSLYKWGGVSLDLDTMVLRSLESLSQNWVVKLSGTNTIVLTSMLALDKDDVGSKITRTILQKMSSPLWPSPNDTFHSFINGTQAMNDVIELCLEKLHKPYADECNGLTINSHEMFCPIDHRYWYVYYYPGDISDMNVPYTHCLWSNLARDAEIHRESPYAKLAKKYCPDIYDMYGEEFGV